MTVLGHVGGVSVVAAAVLALGGTVVVPAADAAATAPGRGARVIALSTDGTTWAHSLAGPLLDPATRWVPGDVRTVRFWVRNQATTSGDVSLKLAEGSAFTRADPRVWRVSVRADGAAWSDIAGPRDRAVRTARALPVGRATAVDLRVEMREGAGNASMVLDNALDFDVVMADSRAASPELPATPSSPSIPTAPLAPAGPAAPTERTDGVATAPLPRTGSPVPAWAVPAAAGLFALGLSLLVVAARRRRHDEEATHAAVVA